VMMVFSIRSRYLVKPFIYDSSFVVFCSSFLVQ